MSALADAIRRGRPRLDLTRESPFAGLHRRHASVVDVVAQSIAATAPAGVMLVHPGAQFGRSGSLAFTELVLTVGLVVAVALVIGMFSRRISSTGSLYTFTTRGLGPWAGIVGGSALAMGYLAIAMNTLSSGAMRIAGLVTSEPGSIAGVAVAVMVCTTVITAGVIARGLRMSTRILLVLETIAVAAVLAISFAALSSTGWDLAPLVPRPTEFSPDIVMVGIAFALIGFVGFESGAALGPESRRPFASVPRGILVSVFATGAVVLVGTAAQLALVADDPTGPWASAAGIGWFVDLIVATSFLACSLAMTNAATRLAFALSREGVIPGVFGRVSPRGVPAAGAILIALVVLSVPSAVLLLGGSRDDLRIVTSPAGMIGFLLAYALVCVAAPVFLARIGELTTGAAVLSTVAGTALLAVLCTAVASTTATDPIGLVAVLAILGLVSSAGMVRLRRGTGVIERVGVHDWAVASDTIGGDGEVPR
ncbi:APC family permease [Microbacterium immunditiarum]|uniref:Amino acid transporter n=1 Tax=Microbacterium immunditiarum TaxID=337480 RepID=A0A7Y9GMN8_9MICO|nr:APC family permease [Microbacterium immunditiarum]NYE19324.1 amino acid transporter [Microbacterium immunditiarum]